MRYASTRSADIVSPGREAIVRGLSSDGGLFAPEELNFRIDPADLSDLSYQEIAETILSAFFDDFPKETIRTCVNSAYCDAKFDDPAIVPVKPFSDGCFTELWHGPTSAFKDLALTILPYLLTSAYEQCGQNGIVAILTATSGDTGKAALSGFADVKNTHVTVFYPENGVSPIQKKQMKTSRGDNVNVIGINGNFDDCQRIVKAAFASEEVKSACSGVILSSANSINIGRLVPQIVYYYSTYLSLVKQGKILMGEEIAFVVPTGNFGDVLAGYLAKRIGLPVSRLIVASNSNNVLTDFLETGTYNRNRPFHETMSPSMDILISSNLERLLYLESGHDAKLVSSLMKQLDETGSYTVPSPLLASIQNTFSGFWCSEEDCRKEIRNLYQQEGILIDPHTAVALSALHQYREEGHREYAAVLSTASPFKFSRDVLACIDTSPIKDDFEAMERLSELSGLSIPKGLAELKTLPERFDTVIEKDQGIAVIAGEMKELSNG